MTDWYLAPSLRVLRAEINARWPNRDKASDGSIGDAAHQATRSDHNPNERGAVDAIDVDNDGIDPYVVIAAFQRHPSAHYWIYQRQIADKDDGWRRRPYDGPSPHTEHVHFSIRQSRTAEQDTRPWGLLEDTMTPAEFVTILRDPTVAALMRALPWQYEGGGIPAGMSALGCLNELVVRARAAGDDPAEIVAGILAAFPLDQLAATIVDKLPAADARRLLDEMAARLAT